MRTVCRMQSRIVTDSTTSAVAPLPAGSWEGKCGTRADPSLRRADVAPREATTTQRVPSGRGVTSQAVGKSGGTSRSLLWGLVSCVCACAHPTHKARTIPAASTHWPARRGYLTRDGGGPGQQSPSGCLRPTPPPPAAATTQPQLAARSRRHAVRLCHAAARRQMTAPPEQAGGRGQLSRDAPLSAPRWTHESRQSTAVAQQACACACSLHLKAGSGRRTCLCSASLRRLCWACARRAAANSSGPRGCRPLTTGAMLRVRGTQPASSALV